MKTIILGIVLALLPFSVKAVEHNYPLLTGSVVDNANQIPEPQEQLLVAELTDFQKKTGHQLVVVTVPNLSGQDVKEYTFNLAESWAVGRAGADDGILLLQSPGDGTPGSGKIRIEVGTGLEYALTDVQTGRIIRDVMVPILKQSRPREETTPEALLAGARELIRLASVTPEEKQLFDSQAQAASDKQSMLSNNLILSTFFQLGVLFGVVSIVIFSIRRRANKSKPIVKQANDIAHREEERFIDEQASEKTHSPRDYYKEIVSARKTPTTYRESENHEPKPEVPSHRSRVEGEPRPSSYSSYSGYSSSDNDSSSSSSSDSYSGGGGDFGGGGSDSSY